MLISTLLDEDKNNEEAVEEEEEQEQDAERAVRRPSGAVTHNRASFSAYSLTTTPNAATTDEKEEEEETCWHSDRDSANGFLSMTRLNKLEDYPTTTNDDDYASKSLSKKTKNETLFSAEKENELTVEHPESQTSHSWNIDWRSEEKVDDSEEKKDRNRKETVDERVFVSSTELEENFGSKRTSSLVQPLPDSLDSPPTSGAESPQQQQSEAFYETIRSPSESSFIEKKREWDEYENTKEIIREEENG